MVCLVWENRVIIANARKLIGATNPLQVETCTIQDDLQFKLEGKVGVEDT
jgi:nucleoside diphosphate kinase